MSLYTIALLLHGSGAIGACVCLGIWLCGHTALRRVRRVEQVRTLAWLIIVVSPLMVLILLLLPETTLKAIRPENDPSRTGWW